jgi:AcrR family transcriptional regulator
VSSSRRQLGAAFGDPHRRREQPLSRDQIVREAIRFLKHHDIEELSMRRLAAELGTAATSLYWHLETKEHLLDLVLDDIFGQVRVPDPDAGTQEQWTDDLRAIARDLRRALRSFRPAATLVVSRPAVGPNALRVFEHILATLRRGGLSDQEIPFAYDVLANYVIGSVLVESSWLQGAEGPDPATRTASIGEYLGSLPKQEYPTLVELSGSLFSHDEDEKFEFGLDRLLSGISREQPDPAAG